MGYNEQRGFKQMVLQWTGQVLASVNDVEHRPTFFSSKSQHSFNNNDDDSNGNGSNNNHLMEAVLSANSLEA